MQSASISTARARPWRSFGLIDLTRPARRVAVGSGEREVHLVDRWCDELGRDRAAVERTVAIRPSEVGNWAAYVQAGADHIIVMTDAPFDLDPVATLMEALRS